jgi:MoaA/NifB/PqqE/SkfB family radical SAM enzyme
MGCMMGGLSHLYIDSLGNVEPCVFVPVAFGNILKEDFSEIYARMRAVVPYPLRAPCPSLTLTEIFRSKKREGIQLPIPYLMIPKEWEKLYRL